MKALLLFLLYAPVRALNIVIAGGTGRLGPGVAAQLKDHNVMLLARNAFLASAPARVTQEFGWVGQTFLENNPHVSIRDWDGGDMTDIVGCDFLGWQEDALVDADIVVNLVGGFTHQREMATERIVRESLRVNPQAMQIVATPKDEDIKIFTPGMYKMKVERLKKCEDMVAQNCMNSKCVRLEAHGRQKNVQKILDVILSDN